MVTPHVSNSLSPATDVSQIESFTVQAVEPQQPGSLSLSLYHLSDELVSLLAVREEMAESKEDTTEVDEAIAAYMAALPEKVDQVVHVLRAFESQAEFAAAEIQRLAARRRRIASAVERLKEYCCSVLEKLPQPKKGSRKLEGETATLILKGNGGQQALDVYDESLVPDEYCIATVTMHWCDWLKVLADYEAIPGATATRSVDNAAVREALKASCWICDGNGVVEPTDDPSGQFEHPGSNPCSACGGSGKSGVPGARLLERRHHLEIR